jgi:hypothetical protein
MIIHGISGHTAKSDSYSSNGARLDAGGETVEAKAASEAKKEARKRC